MEQQAILRTEQRGRRAPPASPPAVWAAFVAQGAWKSWTIVGLLGLAALEALAVARLTTRPPEVVLLDAAGRGTPIRRSVATDALLAFLAERTRPPDVAIVRFTRDFLHRAMALNSSTIEANWPAALEMMAPELRAKIEAQAAHARLVERWRLAQRRTEIAFEDVVVEDPTAPVLDIRATLTRRTGPLIEGTGPSSTDRVLVALTARTVSPTLERPDGLEVVEWRLEPLPVTGSAYSQGGKEKEVTGGP